MRKNILKRIVLVLVLTIMCTIIVVANESNPEKIAIKQLATPSEIIISTKISEEKPNSTDITSKFTDANFKTAVYALIGKTSTAPILYSDVKTLKTLNVASKGISSLNGIEYFTDLTNLNCEFNQLTTLDVSKNTALTALACEFNQLTTLDVSKNKALTDLYCESNQLTTLDLSNNTLLTRLWCEFNQLTKLYVHAIPSEHNSYNPQYTTSENTETTGNLVELVK